MAAIELVPDRRPSEFKHQRVGQTLTIVLTQMFIKWWAVFADAYKGNDREIRRHGSNYELR
jgi:hypothetical protein